jgi:hypothetical protein
MEESPQKEMEYLYTDKKSETFYCINKYHIKDFFCEIKKNKSGSYNEDNYNLTYNKKAPSDIDFFSYVNGKMVSSKMNDANCGKHWRSYSNEYQYDAEYIYVLQDGLEKLFKYFNSPPETSPPKTLPETCIGSLCKRFFTPRVYSTGGKRTRKQKYSARSRGINTLRKKRGPSGPKGPKSRRKIEHSTSFRNKR